MNLSHFSWRIILLSTTLFLLAGLAVLCAWAAQQVLAGLPDPTALQEHLNTPSVRITDRQGRILYEALPEQGGRHAAVPLSAIPLNLQQATVATEDRSFYRNPGVDLGGILRAVWINLRGGETLAGGSTITQQVARNLLLSQEERSRRSVVRKLREVLLAYRLTQRYTKDEILALYLNQMYYGGLAYGVEAAAQTYFSKPAAQLDLAEAALLAGLPQSPARYNPFTDLEAAKGRQKVVLGLMEQAGYISAEQRQQAEREPLVFARDPYPILAPHFVMLVRSQLDELLSPEEIYQRGGVVVRTTLDLDWQEHALQAIQRQLKALQRSDDGQGHNVKNAALVALDPHSGEILAMVGSPDYFDQQNAGAINMAISPRQPGSTLKPLVYAAAFDSERPDPWTAATMLLDVRTSFVTHEGQAYVPANYDLKEHGPVLARDALASSLNIPAVLALQHIGMKDLFELAGRLGITTLVDPDRYDLSLALGGGEVRLIELTAAYGAFANGGMRVAPNAILEVGDFQGNILYQPPAPALSQAAQRVLDERVAWLISDILSDNDARRLGFGEHTILRLDRPAAVKTGTTTNFHDNWTIGYTPDLVTGVWVGNTNYEPMRQVNGLTGAAPIWAQFMRAVLTGRPEKGFTRPPGLVQVEVCQLSGLLPTSACPYRREEWFLQGTQPKGYDTFYKIVSIDPLTGALLPGEADQGGQENRGLESRVVLDLPPQAQPWARAHGLQLLSDLRARLASSSSAGAEQAGGGAELHLASPAQGAVYRQSVNVPARAQRLHLQALTGLNRLTGLRQVSLWVDGEQVAVFDLDKEAGESPFQGWWTLAPGQHQAWASAVLEGGRQIESQRVEFEVLAPLGTSGQP